LEVGIQKPGELGNKILSARGSPYHLINNMKKYIRLLKQMKKVVYDKSFAKQHPDLELYYIYRGINLKNGIRYDETIIPGQMLGNEFTRTKGNQNSNNFPELYTILNGQAIFLMQEADKEIVKNIVAIKANKGDYIIIGPECSIVVINPVKTELKLGNWVSEQNQNIYSELSKMNGMAYFYTKNGWIKNKNYNQIPELRFEKPLKQKPGNLDFLNG